MKNNRLYVDIHVIQTIPPSCVNRDDTGSPKTAVYGGVTRARVSSQSWKRAMRDMFQDTLPNEQLAVRSKRIVAKVTEEIKRLGDVKEPEKKAESVLKLAGLTIKDIEDKKTKTTYRGTEALFFLSEVQAKGLARLAAQNSELSKNEAQNALKQYPGIEVALFGRMVADDPSLNTDACAQVAHSISTHKVSNEYDYFTAMDDLSPEDKAGATHLGSIEFNSSTLYRYATVAVHQLIQYLGDDTIMAVGEFVRAFVCSMPAGKQNTFANCTLPDALLLTLRTDQPINLVGAFEKPVPARDKGYFNDSAGALARHAQETYHKWLGKPELSLVIGEQLSQLGELLSLKELLDKLAAALQARLSNGGGL
ncbi:MAG: type I-E CRISPR-associated protein Cas7/Cse4/CasC [Desulfarculales bacterium]|jgi:CRISPR system Cascade subunit CasC|nr:type I-E CRISPR-associated protein Cas7/Cse4/CasC [Desulfarculales bacterium]